jgi:predicted O-methyltransferase YrrM
MREVTGAPADEVRDIINLVSRIPNDGSLTMEEGLCLYNLARTRHVDGVIVEIGSWQGRSTIWLAKGALADGKTKIYAIDPHIEHTLTIFKQNIKRAGIENVVIPIVMKSEEAVKGWNEPISLLWIDGSHDYEDVKKDLLFYEPYLQIGGIVAFHDCWAWSGPRRLIRERVLISNQFTNIRCTDRVVFATKASVPSLTLSEIRVRLWLLIMSYSAAFFSFLTSFELLKPLQNFLRQASIRILR